MNAFPVFTDSRGREIKPPKPPVPIQQWTPVRALGAVLLVAVLALGSFAAVTQINLASQVSGILPAANGGLGANASAFTGILRDASGTATAAELSGDCATSGSNVVTCAKVNSTTVPTNSASDQVLETTASATGAWKTIGDTSAGGLAETYN